MQRFHTGFCAFSATVLLLLPSLQWFLCLVATDLSTIALRSVGSHVELGAHWQCGKSSWRARGRRVIFRPSAPINTDPVIQPAVNSEPFDSRPFSPPLRVYRDLRGIHRCRDSRTSSSEREENATCHKRWGICYLQLRCLGPSVPHRIQGRESCHTNPLVLIRSHRPYFVSLPSPLSSLTPSPSPALD